MEIKEEGKKVLDAAEAKLAGLKEIVTRKGWTKWLIVALAVLVALVVVLLLTSGKARATGTEHAVMVITKAIVTPAVVTPAVVVPAVVTPAAIVPAAPTIATTVAAPAATTAPATPAHQPAYSGGSSTTGWLVFTGVGVFLYAAICTAERTKHPGRVNNTQGWFARNCRPQDWFK